MSTPRAGRGEELMLSIGGMVGHLDLVGANAVFVKQLRERYGAFEMPAAERVERDFSLRLDLAAMARPPGTQADVDRRPLTVTAEGRAISIERWDIAVRLAAAPAGRARRTVYRGEGRCEMSPFAVDCVLRVVFATLLPRAGGLLVHGCGLRHAEVGFVFPGASGAGKTTLARKAPDADDVLSDEMVALRLTDDGWRVYGTPFWGDFARGGISMRSWPLRCVGFLSQRESVAMAPITSSEATLRLLACFVCFQTDRETVQRNLDVAARLCSDVRSVEAQLTRDATTTEIFRKLGPHLGVDIERRIPPYSPREMISEFRSFLRKHQLYAFSPRGAGLRPWVKQGDSLLIQATEKADLDVGDIALYWSPGRTPDDDVLLCHRVGSPLPKGQSWAHAQVLGRVSGLARDGRDLPMPGRLDGLGRLFGAQVAMPILRLAGR